MSDLSRLADTLAGMAGGGARMLAAQTTGVVGEVTVNGALLRPGRWINQPPPGAGQPVLLLLQDGMAVAVGEDSGAKALDLISVVQELAARVAALEGGR